MQISGSTVLLTGATGGLGKAIARALHARGGELILTGRRSDVLEPRATELDDARTLAVDLATRPRWTASCWRPARWTFSSRTPGFPPRARLETFTIEQVDRTLDVNLRAPIALSHALLGGMLERGRGHLLFMSSIAGKTTRAGNPLYHATKYGLRGFAAALRTDLHDSGVGVSGSIPRLHPRRGCVRRLGCEDAPGCRHAQPEDVARGVVDAIEHNRGEVDVAPLTQRGGAVIAGFAPDLAASVVRKLGGQDIARKMEQGLRDKR